MKKINLSGEMLVFLGVLFWSLNSPLIKFLEVDALLTCGTRSLIAGLFLLPFLKPKKLNWSPWMIVYLASFTTLCISIVYALRMTSSAIAIGMQYASIVWLFLTNIILTKKAEKGKLLPVIVISVGVILFMLSGLEGSSMTGNLIAFTEGITFAVMTVAVKKTAGENPLGLTAIANLFTGIFVFLVLPPSLGDLTALTGLETFLMLVLGVVQVGLGYAFYNMGVNKTTPQKAAVLAPWEMILGLIWVAIFLGEYPTLLVTIGAIVIVIGILLDAKGEPNERKA